MYDNSNRMVYLLLLLFTIIVLFYFFKAYGNNVTETFKSDSDVKNNDDKLRDEIIQALNVLREKVKKFKKKFNKFHQENMKNIKQKIKQEKQEKQENFIGGDFPNLKLPNNKYIEQFSLVSSTLELGADKCEWAERDINKTLDNIDGEAKSLATKVGIERGISTMKLLAKNPKLFGLINYLSIMTMRYKVVCMIPGSFGGYVYDFSLNIKDFAINLSEKMSPDIALNKPNPCDLDTDCKGFMEGEKCCRGFCTKDTCTPSKIGEWCKLATDCEGWGSLGDHIVCCNPDGKDKNADLRAWGRCTKPCINTGVGWCPKQTDLKCEKALGEDCNLDTDCVGWGSGVGGKGVKCCQGVCKDVKGKCALSKIGEKARLATDCENNGTLSPQKIVVCKEDGSDFILDLEGWGVCTKPCVNSGAGWCPKQTDLKCEKEIGENCSGDTDCNGWGFGVGGRGVKCCSGFCREKDHGNAGKSCSNNSDCCGRDCKLPFQSCPFGTLTENGKRCCKDLFGKIDKNNCIDDKKVCW